MFVIDAKDNENGGCGYEVTLQHGTAAYMNLMEYEKYTFWYNNEEYEVKKIMESYVKETFDADISVDYTRVADLSYYDCQNKKCIVQWAGTGSQRGYYNIRTSEFDKYPEHNCTNAFRKNEDVEEQVHRLIDQVKM